MLPRRGKSEDARGLPKKYGMSSLMDIMLELQLCNIEKRVGVVFDQPEREEKEEKEEGERINLQTLLEDEMSRFHLSGEKQLQISMQARFKICLDLLMHLKKIHENGFRFKKIKIPSSMIMVHDIATGKASFLQDRSLMLPLIPSEATANIWGMADVFGQVLLGTAAAWKDGGLQDSLEGQLHGTFGDVQTLVLKMASGDGVTEVDYYIETLTQLRDKWLKEVISSKNPPKLEEEKSEPGLSPRPRH